MRISVIGLGKLGAPLAAVLAARGFRVVGVDVNPSPVEALNAGRAPVDEPRLQEMIDAAGARLAATTDAVRAVAETDATFIIVPTPSLADGRFSLSYVLDAAEAVGRGMAAKDGGHLVALTSTVMPGDTQGRLLPALEAASGRRCGDGFGLCYNPEFIALGSVVGDLLAPDFVLVGESDAEAGGRLAAIYGRLCTNAPPVARMNFVNAELAKLSVNNFVTARISYANMLARLCEGLPGADVDVVTSALGLDSRIGRKYLRGGMGFGGPCFPRDNVAFSRLARDLGAASPLTDAAQEMNRLQLAHLCETVARHLPPGGTVGLLGLSYKPDTPVVEDSPSVDLARRLAERGHAVVAYDPQAVPAARAVLGEAVAYADSAAECARRADVLALTVPWPEFRELTPADLKPGTRPAVIDCWRLLPRATFEDACTYLMLGAGPAAGAKAPEETAARKAARSQ